MISTLIALVLANSSGVIAQPANDLSRPAVPLSSPLAWISPEDYPMEAILRNAQGTATVRFRVLQNDRVGACDVERSTGSEILDAMTSCALIEVRARYNPELDAEGRAVESVKTMRFTWRLPSADSPLRKQKFGEPFRLEMLVDADADGIIRDCRTPVRVGPVPMPAGDPCLPIWKQGKVSPLIDANGNAVASRLTFSITLMKTAQ